MKVSFIKPIKINKKPTKTFTWSDGCPMSIGSVNPIYRIARNHYQDLYELYKKLYQIGYVCTSQTAIIQVHRYPANPLTFKDFNFHIFQPTFWWYSCDDIDPKNIVTDHRKYWERTNRSLVAAVHILKQFSKKFDKYGRKITVSDKLNQAIKNAKKAERSAKRAEKLVQQYKERMEGRQYIVLVAYDNLWSCTNGSTNANDFLIVYRHSNQDKKIQGCQFSLDYVTAHDILSDFNDTMKGKNLTYGGTYWLTSHEVHYVSKKIAKDTHNVNHPAVLTSPQFKYLFNAQLF